MNTTTVQKTEDFGVDVSVVIPSYNHAHYIVDAIESVLSQSFCNWELILVDDGSTDHTRELLDQRYRNNKQIHLVYQTNQGAHHALNHGISLAKGRYISFLNSDDLYHTERLSILLKHFETHLCGLAFTHLIPIDADGATILNSEHPWCQRYAKSMRLFHDRGPKEALVTGNFAVTTSNFFISTELIKKLGGFRKKRYNHDWDLMVRVLQQGLDIQCVGHQSLMSYRIHEGNTITQNMLVARLELKQILQSLLPENDPYLAKLVLQMQINMRSIRHEHQARVVQKVREGYDHHIEKMLVDIQAQHQMALSPEQAKLKDSMNGSNAQMQNQMDVMALQINSLERHLLEIQNSRSYQLSQFLSLRLNWVKKMFGLVK
jgi:glycosyltransferase involved in cell wall biosynthesis